MTFSRLSRLTRPPKLKSLKTLKDLGGRRLTEQPPPDPYATREKEKFDPTSDDEDKLARELNDRQLAKKIMGQKKTHPYGTVPELLAVDWLASHNEDYAWQVQLNGGFRQGGVVPDILVMRAAAVTALLINGNYWHNLPGMRTADQADKLLLKAQNFKGMPISNAVIVWESRLMKNRDEVMWAAMAGQELGE